MSAGDFPTPNSNYCPSGLVWWYNYNPPDPRIAELEKRVAELERILAEHRLT